MSFTSESHTHGARPGPGGELQTLRLAVEQSFDGIHIVDLQGVIIYANPASEAMYGYQRGELAGKHVSALNIDPQISEAQIIPAVKSRGSWSGELVQKRRDGSCFTVHLSASAVAEAGGMLGMLGIVRDVSEKKRAEQALHRSETRYRMLHESLRDAFVQVGMDGRILEFNELYCQMLGYPPGELRALTYQALTPQRWHALEESIVREQIIAHGYSEVYEKEYRRKDGTIIPVELRTILSRDEAGRPSAMWAIVRDISERKRTEQALRQLNETLERKVAERTALAQARTRQLQALAVELIETEEKERRRFAELLHDDLQQMLAAAKMQLQDLPVGLRHEPLLQGVTRVLEQTIVKTRQLSHELSPALLQTSGLSQALQWLAGRMGEQFGMDVELQAAPDLEVHNASLKIFVFRAVRELLFNIVKHAGVKHARVDVAGGSGALVATVIDHGKGFDPAILENPGGRVGFGLLSIRERVQYIGGSLGVESRPGSGSRFVLTVPLEFAAAKPAATVSTPARADRNEAAARGLIRVLLADDHRVMRQGLVRLLAGQANLQVAGEAANGREAIEKTRQLQPDVIVMDISMPEMDGIEATRRIKTEWPHVRVIGLSMHEDEHICQAMRSAGADCFVNKAASAATLIRAIGGGGRG